MHKAGWNVTTSRRQRDFCLLSLKSKGDQNSRGIEEHTNEGTESGAVVT